MNNAPMTYFQDEDVLYLAISEGQEANSVELYPNVTAELNDKDELIGLEILEASTFVRDYILETAQVKLLNLHHAKKPVQMNPGKIQSSL